MKNSLIYKNKYWNCDSICIVALLCLTGITFFSSNIGILVAGLKLNLADILLFGFALVNLCKCSGKIVLTPSLKYLCKPWIVLIGAYIIWIPLGMFAGAEIQEDIKLIRNLFYVIAVLFFFQKNAKNIREISIIRIFSIITSIDTIVDAKNQFYNNEWFMFSRSNSVAHVYLFCYLLWQIGSDEYFSDKVIDFICCVALLVAAFLSQERTQLIAIVLTIGIVAIIRLCNIGKEKRLARKKVISFFASILVLIILAYMLLNALLRIPFLKNYLDYFYTYRLASGKLFSQLLSNGVKNDGSGSARLLQIQNILSDNIANPFSFLFGRGMNAYYFAAQGRTYIVDGTFLWIFKDMGMFGCLIMAQGVKRLIVPKNTGIGKNRWSVIAGGIAISIFMLTNPTFMMSANASVVFGLQLYILCQRYTFPKCKLCEPKINYEKSRY